MKKMWVCKPKVKVRFDTSIAAITHGLTVGNIVDAEETDPFVVEVNLRFGEVDPLVNKCGLVCRGAEEARVGGKAGDCRCRQGPVSAL